MEKTIEKLQKNGFAVTQFATKEEAADYLAGAIQGKTVGMGGSLTMSALDVYDRLAANNTVYWHWKTPGDDTCVAANNAQVYICSANAVSQEGYLINIDGKCNRVAGTLMKKEKVYFVVGKNKLAGPFDEALARARNVASPMNAKRLERKTPCAVNGRCYDCASPERICSALVVLWRRPWWCDSMEVVLIDEELGS